MSEGKTRIQRSAQRSDRQRSTSRAAHPSPVRHLQRALGNQGMSRLLASGLVQPKLTVNAPGDRHEQEADRIADRVMHMPTGDTLQRACSKCEDEERVQAKQEAAAARADGFLRAAVRSTGDPRPSDDVNFLMQVANQIAIALENSLAYRQLAEMEDEIRLDHNVRHCKLLQPPTVWRML